LEKADENQLVRRLCIAASVSVARHRHPLKLSWPGGPCTGTSFPSAVSPVSHQFAWLLAPLRCGGLRSYRRGRIWCNCKASGSPRRLRKAEALVGSTLPAPAARLGDALLPLDGWWREAATCTATAGGKHGSGNGKAVRTA
jgi:hypothetical protein